MFQLQTHQNKGKGSVVPAGMPLVWDAIAGHGLLDVSQTTVQAQVVCQTNKTNPASTLIRSDHNVN